jgi:hypothetical protein
MAANTIAVRSVTPKVARAGKERRAWPFNLLDRVKHARAEREGFPSEVRDSRAQPIVIIVDFKHGFKTLVHRSYEI